MGKKNQVRGGGAKNAGSVRSEGVENVKSVRSGGVENVKSVRGGGVENVESVRGGEKKAKSRPVDGEAKNKKADVAKLVILLVLVVSLPVIFVGAVAGWFNGERRATIDARDYCEGCGAEMADITGEEYERMVGDERSFVVFVDQEGCTTADKVEGFLQNYAKEKDLRVYRIQFSEARETSMHEKVKYYPSVVVVDRGEIIGFLRADSDEDARAYNDEGEFGGWLGRLILTK